MCTLLESVLFFLYLDCWLIQFTKYCWKTNFLIYTLYCRTVFLLIIDSVQFILFGVFVLALLLLLLFHLEQIQMHRDPQKRYNIQFHIVYCYAYTMKYLARFTHLQSTQIHTHTHLNHFLICSRTNNERTYIQTKENGHSHSYTYTHAYWEQTLKQSFVTMIEMK